MLINVIIDATDSTIAGAPDFVTGLSPTWLHFATYTLDGTTPVVTDQMPGGIASGIVPAVVPIQSGALGYSIWFDTGANGEAIGRLDMGAAIPTPGDRYKLVQFARDSQDIAQTLATVLGTGVVVKVNDTAATAGAITVAGADDAQAGAFIGAVAIVLTGTGAVASAPVTASTAAPVRLTLGSGLTAAPDDGAILWIITVN